VVGAVGGGGWWGVGVLGAWLVGGVGGGWGGGVGVGFVWGGGVVGGVGGGGELNTLTWQALAGEAWRSLSRFFPKPRQSLKREGVRCLGRGKETCVTSVDFSFASQGGGALQGKVKPC